MRFDEIEKQIRSKKFSPVYFFFGEEAYFIDKLNRLLEEYVLASADRSFNSDIVYGPDISAHQLIALARAYPMMATHRLIVVKEAHRMKKDEFDKLTPYIKKPVPSTVMVFLYKTKQKPDGRTSFGKLIASNSVFFESKRLYEKQVYKWVEEDLAARGYKIENQALQVLVSSLGVNLQMIDNELEKVLLHLKANNQTVVKKDLVCELINIDKDFNVFELLNHVGARNVPQCHHIINQLMQNTKDNSPLLIMSQLFGFFSKLALLKQQRCENEQGIVQILGVNPYFAQNYLIAVRNFSYSRIQENLCYILDADLSLKGVHPTRMNEAHIMKTLIYKILQ